MQTEKILSGYPSIDRPWLKYYSTDMLNVKPQECTVYQNICDNDKDYIANLAVCYFGKNISYDELFKNTNLCAKSLKATGIKERDCVTLLMESGNDERRK